MSKPADLRKHAREADVGCLVRIAGVCQWRPTCLAHLRLANVAGVGQKPPDLCGVIACDACHAVIDGRAKTDMAKYELHSTVLYALVRTLAHYATHDFAMYHEATL